MLKDGMAKAQIVAALQGYTNDIDRIVALIPLGNGAKEAQSRLKQLKTATHSDYKHRHSIVSSTQLTPQEGEPRALDPRYVLRGFRHDAQYLQPQLHLAAESIDQLPVHEELRRWLGDQFRLVNATAPRILRSNGRAVADPFFNTTTAGSTTG